MNDMTFADTPETAARPRPFGRFAAPMAPVCALRERIRSATRMPEPDCVPPLLDAAALAPEPEAVATDLATRMVRALRTKGQRGPVEQLMREYSLSSAEGVALMCLAEALLRIPDAGTRDALIRDKIGRGDWRAHLDHPSSLFAGAATFGLLVTGRLVAVADDEGLGRALTGFLGRAGAPVIRAALDRAMRVLGNQFVTGRDIDEALANGRAREAKGFSYSYDMLGEAAMTRVDAERYRRSYAEAIVAIGKASAGRGPIAGPGISIKLSALHPRYGRAQRGRVLAELLAPLTDLAMSARQYGIGLNIDAEEADRLDLSLDLLEALALDPRLRGWDGLGFVVQAYQKRAPHVLAFVIDLARRAGRRIPVRLVKGAYWDTEIKRAQVEGLDGFPVFTRKVHTDVSYLACARLLLAAPDAIYPQFATHNARTVAAVVAMAGPDFRPGDYEFQCLHGMGEGLYEEVVGPDKLGRPCRIYAPVGTHETLLAYLVRRLLENGANASFVHRIGDPAIPVEALVTDSVAEARAIVPLGAGHPEIALPGDLFPDRRNSRGLDLADETVLAGLGDALAANAGEPMLCRPLLGDRDGEGPEHPVLNPADRHDRVGTVIEACTTAVTDAVAVAATSAWGATAPAERCARLEAAADLLEARHVAFLGLLVREAGKSAANAISELREAVDFLRYYAAQARGLDAAVHRPLGPVVCISPWNFPLAIFLGQIAAALAAGNPVLAKPAEETPLVAGLATRLLHEAGVPRDAVQLLPGDGAVGAQLVADARVRGVLFTGSLEAARHIQARLAERLGPEGRPIPLVAETGGQNALVVDSSALPEQVVADVLASAFDSAGQRCSALRVLCLQEEIVEPVLAMLKGAMAELRVGSPDRLSTDVGPVISAEARDRIHDHIARMRARGHTVHATPLSAACAEGFFVAPTLIAIDRFADVPYEVFGPVLHVLRFPAGGLDALATEIDATGYGLTFGIHSRIDAHVARMTERVGAGNLYVNRNMIGAVVGVQPFGGENLSGTGPKAGGPLYLHRLLAAGDGAPQARPGFSTLLPGPVGETNRYSLHPRGTIFGIVETEAGLAAQVAAARASGNRLRVHGPAALRALLDTFPPAERERVSCCDVPDLTDCAAILVEGGPEAVGSWLRKAAAQDGALVPVFAASPEGLARGTEGYAPHWLLRERSVSTNTTAAGGNASLMAAV